MKYILFIFSLIFTQTAISQDYPEALPDFEIFDIKGKPFKTNQITNETYSFFIYFNPECGHCKTAFKTLNLNADEIKELNVTIYPVSAGTKENTIVFFENFSPKIHALNNTKILRDDDFKFADAFFVGGYPTSYLYDKDHNLIKVYNGEGEIMNFLEDIK